MEHITYDVYSHKVKARGTFPGAASFIPSCISSFIEHHHHTCKTMITTLQPNMSHSAECYDFILSLFTQTCQSQLSIFFQTNETSNQLSLSRQHLAPSPEGEDGVHGRLLAEGNHHLLTLWRQTLQLLQGRCHSCR